jgi:hypothetical protein
MSDLDRYVDGLLRRAEQRAREAFAEDAPFVGHRADPRRFQRSASFIPWDVRDEGLIEALHRAGVRITGKYEGGRR